MELGPPVGRPPKDPEERRSELVHIRLRRSHRLIIEQEAERRGTTMTIVVVRIAFEEMNPSGRHVPRSAILEWLLDESYGLLDRARDPCFGLQPHHVKPSRFKKKARQVSKKRETREDRWAIAQDQTCSERVGVRLKPGRLNWLEQRAGQKETSRSGLLRVRALQGIKKRDRRDQIEENLRWGAERAAALRLKAENGMTEEVFRDRLEDFANEMGGWD